MLTKYRFWTILIIAASLWAIFVLKDSSFKLGLDLSGGTHLVYRADTLDVESNQIEDAMQSLRDTIERRVNLFGVAEPIVQVEKGGILGDSEERRLIVELPGITDIEEAVKKIGETPILEFKLLDKKTETFKQTNLSGRHLERAEIRFDSGSTSGKPIIGLNFNDEGDKLFAQITRENVGEVLGIFLDGTLIEAPFIREEITGGEAVITGDFTIDEAKRVVRDLNYGALPMPINLISSETIGPTLGTEALQSGIKAAVVGLSLVALFMIVWYRLPGFLATLALAVYVIIMLLLFKSVPITLTVAGIAGFIISIGMAIDANVIIFERMREVASSATRRGGGKLEIDGGVVKEAFSHAWTAIRDGQLTTLFGAIVLFWFGTSSVEGFALVLGLGTIISVFSSMVISKIFMNAVYSK
ncbi:MAG: protein translocase subunit SecD [Patescibacteria group bacterium]